MGYPDLLGMHAIDPDGVGIRIIAPLPTATTLRPRSRERWKMLGAHIASGYRLRRALAAMGAASQADPTGLPLEAEAVIDAQGFRLVDAVGPAKEANAASVLRRAARTVDRSRGQMRVSDPQRALDVWTALVGGRWSIVDWFDTDGRRFVLAMPNSPGVADPRGLTERECQVVSYIVRGDTSKLVAYRLGLSPARVSGLLKSAMHKLGVKSRAGLVRKLGPLGAPTGIPGDESAV
jgi:DNA-binding CsgD family transcriptional regulator